MTSSWTSSGVQHWHVLTLLEGVALPFSPFYASFIAVHHIYHFRSPAMSLAVCFSLSHVSEGKFSSMCESGVFKADKRTCKGFFCVFLSPGGKDNLRGRYGVIYSLLKSTLNSISNHGTEQLINRNTAAISDQWSLQSTSWVRGAFEWLYIRRHMLSDLFCIEQKEIYHTNHGWVSLQQAGADSPRRRSSHGSLPVAPLARSRSLEFSMSPILARLLVGFRGRTTCVAISIRLVQVI